MVCAASGGRFRGTIGRTLFQTTGLFQSVLKPGVVTNKVGLGAPVSRAGSGGQRVALAVRPALRWGGWAEARAWSGGAN